jgi:hypothetical protein
MDILKTERVKKKSKLEIISSFVIKVLKELKDYLPSGGLNGMSGIDYSKYPDTSRMRGVNSGSYGHGAYQDPDEF